MKITKIVVFFIIIIGIFIVVFTVVRYREEIQELITNRTKKTVDQALTFFNAHLTEFDPKSSQPFLSLFTDDYRKACFYSPDMERFLHGEINFEGFNSESAGKDRYNLRNYIVSWKLKKEKNQNGTYTINVDGRVANLEGYNGTTGEPIYRFHQNPEKVRFILEKNKGKWLIKDSYNFLLFLSLQDSVTEKKSDLEKFKILEELSNKTEVHINDLAIVEDVGSYFTCKVNGVIVNKSNIPIYYAAIRINFSGMNKYSKNTYHFAPIDEVVQPHERKYFTLNENVYYHSSDKDHYSAFSFNEDHDQLSYKYSYRLILE
jgi:hypothetical protein